LRHCIVSRDTGQQVRVRHLSVNDLLPPTDDYITYEGSLTEPGCHETVTWVIPNKPIYITNEQVESNETSSSMQFQLLTSDVAKM